MGPLLFNPEEQPMNIRTSALALFALTAIAGAAQAHSSVKLYGLINTDVGQYQEAGSPKLKGMKSGNMATSFWGIGGAEELGGGTKAIFAMEGFFLADSGSQGRFNGDNFFARSAYVGLSGDWGLVKMGRNTNLTFLSLLLFNSFGDSFGFSPTILHYFTDGRGFSARLQGDSGWSNSITYASPKFAGFQVNVQGAFSEGSTNGSPSYGGNVIYNAGGPFSATVSYQTVGTGAGVVVNQQKENTWTAGAAYDFGFAKFFVQYGKIKDKQYATENKIWDVSASVPVTPKSSVLLAYGHSKLNTVVTPKRKTASVAYDYFLSKRTDVYVTYMNDKLPDAALYATGNTFAVGIKHAF
jgi:predicted porin